MVEKALECFYCRKAVGWRRRGIVLDVFEASIPCLCEVETCNTAVNLTRLPFDVPGLFDEFQALRNAAFRLAEVVAQILCGVRISVANRQIMKDFKVYKLDTRRAGGLSHLAFV